MVSDRMKEFSILHSLIPEAPSHSRTMEDLPREILEGRIHLASEHLMVFVSESIMEEPCGHPSSRFKGGLPPCSSPVAQKARHPSHVLPSGLFRLRPTREDPLGGVHNEGVQRMVGKGRRAYQSLQASRMWLSIRRVRPQWAATATTAPGSTASNGSNLWGCTISPYWSWRRG